MKKMWRIFQVIGIVSLVTLITAVSCGKKGGGGNSGGGATIVVTNLLASASEGFTTHANPIKVDGTDISVKIASFSLRPSSSYGTSNFGEVAAITDTGGKNKLFDFALSGASGGLMLVAPGNVASVSAFTTPAIVTAVPADTSANEGLLLVAAAAESGFVAQGLNIYGVFMSKDTNSAYAFSEATEGSIGTAKPQFFCRAVAPEITTTTPAATTTLKGAQKAECFATRYGYSSPSTEWLGSATRKTIEVAVAVIQTDNKKLSEIGLEGADDAAKVTAFTDGLNAADMAKLIGANKTVYRKFKITLVANDAF